MYSQIGFGFEPVSTAVAASTVARTAGGLISTIGSIFGYAPRGELQKFQRTHYPYMRTLAAQSGYNVYIWWFGQVVMVAPDGSYGVAIDGTGQNWDWQYAYSLIPTVEYDAYYITNNMSSDPVNRPQDDVFTLMQGLEPLREPITGMPTYTAPATYPPTQPGLIDSEPYQAGFLPTGTGYMLPLIVLAGIAAVVAFTGPIKVKK